MTCEIIPFPAGKIVRLLKFGRLANYCGLCVQVLAENNVNALVAYGDHRGWIPRGSLTEWERVMAGEDKPCDSGESV